VTFTFDTSPLDGDVAYNVTMSAVNHLGIPGKIGTIGKMGKKVRSIKSVR
jgi:hypothetical protein